MASEGMASRDSAAFEARARITSRRKEGRGYLYFREPPEREVRRTTLPRTRVNKLAHGRQAGKASYAGSSVSLVRPEPSEFIT